MQTEKARFAQRLQQAMQAAGYAPKPSVLEREFNLRHWGKPMTLHGVRRWLRGETLPDHQKLQTLAQWLRVPIEELAFGRLPSVSKAKAQEWPAYLSVQDHEVLQLYAQLSGAKKQILRETILAFAQAEAYASGRALGV